MAILSSKHLNVGYSRNKNVSTIQSDLNLELFRGELVCLMGPNGSGKSTLIRTLGGLQKELSGDILIESKSIKKISKIEKAQKIALVLTDRVQISNARVFDIVALGQFPYSHWLKGLPKESREKVNDAIKMVHMEDFSNRFFDELSDGEKQKVMIAKALTQNTPIIILDEPTAHLDLPNKVEIMLLLHQLAHTTNKAILLSSHELDLALQAADKIWLMDKEGVTTGVPEDLVLNGTFDKVFKSSAYFFNPSNGNFSMSYDLHKKVSIEGDNTKMYWTLRALARAGYYADDNTKIHISIEKNGWEINNELYPTIESLLSKLNEIYA